MKRTLVSVGISITLGLCLLLGTNSTATFAFYVLSIFNCLAWLGVLCGVIKGDAAARIRRHSWISGLSTAFQLYALIVADHPLLAASCFMVSFFIVVLAFADKGRKPCAD